MADNTNNSASTSAEIDDDRAQPEVNIEQGVEVVCNVVKAGTIESSQLPDVLNMQQEMMDAVAESLASFPTPVPGLSQIELKRLQSLKPISALLKESLSLTSKLTLESSRELQRVKATIETAALEKDLPRAEEQPDAEEGTLKSAKHRLISEDDVGDEAVDDIIDSYTDRPAIATRPKDSSRVTTLDGAKMHQHASVVIKGLLQCFDSGMTSEKIHELGMLIDGSVDFGHMVAAMEDWIESENRERKTRERGSEGLRVEVGFGSLYVNGGVRTLAA